VSSGFTEQEFGPGAEKPLGPDPKTQANGHDADPWPVLAAEAYHGLAGEVVNTISPQTEADPVSLLMQFLVFVGNAIGRGPHYQVNRDRHYTNLYILLVGASAKARKGLAAGLIRALLEVAEPNWANSCIHGGMSSGEGVLHAIRDAVYTVKKGVSAMTDPGVADKRLLLDEREFYSALAVMQREGNIVSRVVRDAWDCLPVLRTMTKNTQTRVANAFISIVGHITTDELRQTLDHTSMANGYANRFLFACVHRSKELPFGGDVVEMPALGAKVQAVIETARAVERITMTASAKELWRDVYPALSAERPGLLAAVTARAEAQTIRLALIYALLDGASAIDRVHLEAALAMWKYCEASARYIFGDLLGNTTADAILRALRQVGASGMSRTAINDLFGRNRSSGNLQQALELLLTSGRARYTSMPTSGRRGRPTETWYAV